MTDKDAKSPVKTTRALAEEYLRSVLEGGAANFCEAKHATSKVVLQHIPADAVAPDEHDPLVELQKAAEEGRLKHAVSPPLDPEAIADAIRG